MPESFIKRGTIWWVDLPPPEDSELGDRHSVLVLQINDFTRTTIHTVIGAVITSNVYRAGDSGNVLITPDESGLAEISVVNVSQIVTFDKLWAVEKIGKLSENRMREVETGVKLWLGLS